MNQTLYAIVLMIAGMLFFALGDMFLKLATLTLSFGGVTLILGIGMSAVFGVMALRQKQAFFSRQYLHLSMVMRCIGEAVGIIGIIIALAYSPISTVTALMQSLPLILTFMGAVFLGETVGIRRILAMTAGLIGVLIIIRPGTDDFDVFASFTLVGVLGMAIRDFGTRIAPGHIATSILSFYGSLALIITGLIMVWADGDFTFPEGQAWSYCFGLVVTAALGTYAVSSAMRLTDIAIISPFRFSRVIFGVAIGIFMFHETIDLQTAIGAVIVVSAGLYSWLRERILASTQTCGKAC